MWLQRRRHQDTERVRESVLGGHGAQNCEPGVGDAVVEDMNCMFEEDATLSKLGNHVQKGKLVYVEKCWEPERKWRAGAGVRGWRR